MGRGEAYKGRLLISFMAAEEEDVASMAGKVIECSYSPETGTWNFMRIRHDKENPNAFHVFHKVSSNLNFVVFCSSSS